MKRNVRNTIFIIKKINKYIQSIKVFNYYGKNRAYENDWQASKAQLKPK